MTELEKRLKNGEVAYQVNDLFGWTDIRILDETPSSDKDFKQLLEDLLKEVRE